MQQLAAAFQKPDPMEGLDQFIGVLCRFWASDQVVFRRLGALAALDPELAQEVDSRGQGGQQGLRVLLDKIAAATGRPRIEEMERVFAVLFTLISFQMFDNLQTQLGLGAGEIAELLRRLARCAIG